MARTVLVTGAAGFIGASLSQRLLQQGDRVVGLDNLNDYYDPSLKQARLRQIEAVAPEGAWHFVEMALEDGDALMALFDAEKPTVVVNLAAQASGFDLGRIGDSPGIKDPSRLAHPSGQIRPVQLSVVLPFGEHQHGIGAHHGILNAAGLSPTAGSTQPIHLRGWLLTEIPSHLISCNLGIVDDELRALLQKIATDANRRSLTGVVGVGLERKTKNRQALPRHGAE